MVSSIWAHARGSPPYNWMLTYLQKHGELHMGPCKRGVFFNPGLLLFHWHSKSPLRRYAWRAPYGPMHEVLQLQLDFYLFAEAWWAPYGPMLYTDKMISWLMTHLNQPECQTFITISAWRAPNGPMLEVLLVQWDANLFAETWWAPYGPMLMTERWWSALLREPKGLRAKQNGMESSIWAHARGTSSSLGC